MSDELDTQEQELDEVEQEEVEEVEGESNEEEDGNSNSSDDDQSGSRNKRPFLEIDERTKYNTREEAIKGYAEAGKRIAALSAWEKELKEYDVTPTDVRAYLDELIESRQTAAQLRSELEQFKKEREQEKQESSNKTRVEAESKLTREEKDAVEWLKERMPNLGYISKEEAMKLINQLQEKTDRIGKIESYIQESQARERQTLIDSGRTEVIAKMKEDGFTDDEDGSLRMLVESSIKDWVNSDEKRIQRFYAGGNVTRNLIMEGYERAKKALGLLKVASGNNYVKSKAEALKRNTNSKLPNSASVPNKGKKVLGKVVNKRVDASGKRDYIGEVHNKAWEKFQSISNRNEEE